MAVGLAQGFIEPLEATALHLVQETVVQFIGAKAGKETLHFQDAFNDNIRSRFLGIKDYISAHYCASNRVIPSTGKKQVRQTSYCSPATIDAALANRARY